MHCLGAVPSRIEDYALIGDCQTAALVSRSGSIDWLCLPRFDSGACFAALLGGPEHGRWIIAPRGHVLAATRSYRDGTLILDTVFETEHGAILLTDCMPMRDVAPHLLRVVRGLRGRVPVHTEIVVRFEYGSIVPWVRKTHGGIRAIAGPNSLRIQSDVPLRGVDMTTVSEFEVGADETVSFALTWHPSHVKEPHPVDTCQMVANTEATWREWAAQCTYGGDWRDAVVRSLVTLKALTHTATGGILAAPTTSLPEGIGGTRNWDYRYAWVRDATFTLLALVAGGYRDEARDWREWMLRAVAGDPSKLQIMYAIDGARRIPEWTVDWLQGFEGSRPVRVGNAASEQRQLDVYGELLDAMYQCHAVGLPPDQAAWDLQRMLLEYLESSWAKPDNGIWEVRGPERQFTHSKVMAWVAFDRGIRTVEGLGMRGPIERWRAARDRIHEEVCRHGYDAELGAFVQYYGSRRLDASLLMVPLVGFLPPTDERVRGTARLVAERLVDRGLVRRYDTSQDVEGVGGREGAFLPCSFWLADNWALMGRRAEARALFERLIDLRNDVGLLSEEYDADAGRLVGNFPQAFSHVSLVNTAHNIWLADGGGPARHRRHA
ncbi:MAG TPA: glycoside hydrolase family 15 protein [Polyangiaceae bacterium]|nr:glycoside hydrolase family 15 protein [Polyangiaceae bacterium]